MVPRFADVDAYIASFPPEARGALEDVRRTIRSAVPDADEKISYGMATVTLDGRPLVYFAGWKNHVGVYPVPVGSAEFERRVAPFRRAKDTVRFPLGRPMPLELLEEIAALAVRRRVREPR